MKITIQLVQLAIFFTVDKGDKICMQLGNLEFLLKWVITQGLIDTKMSTHSATAVYYNIQILNHQVN